MSFKTLLSIMLGQRGRRVRRDVSPGYNVDREALERALGSLAPELREEPQDAALRLDGGQVATGPGQPGRALAVEATAEKIVNTVASLGPDYPFAPAYRILEPRIQDVGGTKAKVEDMLSREIHLTARGTHNGETFTWQWTLSRQAIATWLRIEKTDEDPGFAVRLDETAIQATVADLAAEREADEWGFPAEEVSQKIVEALQAGGGEVAVELTPPPRVYIVQAGDRLTAIAEEFGMPPGLIAERNPGLDLDRLSVGQKLIIPPQEVLTPYETVPGKRIVISIAEQRLRVYDNEQLLHEWPCSTGKTDSPTYRGHFQVLSKEEMAYASQWDLQMPHFIGIYRAGGETYNGIHALPILSNGQRLWAGNLGSRASFGCIVLGIDEAAALYKWAELGVPVIIE
jgi:lipoprotein-anchoring transpeptidase ErfK/SrfK